MDHEGLVV